ncbi:MAG: 3-hydroxyacyl-CoA dehydrogenase NAD-binding domain-containing protein [Chloroflexota bacterium]|nr:3-hydroxyacyl-CoA dehydrogenase NAD-binding domain-containing protein [Chloroflexota bacterium]MDE2918258.1 3-hydroxyacyl-CoA dehydrogenase NAD-binding domain-containing protein [Chloroflexota bacterium]
MRERPSGEGSRAAVIGAGRMGHGIALEAARGGFAVAIHDSQPGRAEVAIAEAEADAQDLVAAGLIRTCDIPTIVGRLMPTANLESAAAGAEVVFEAVAEDLEVKRSVFARLDRAAPPGALLLSNTSSLGISAIASACRRPERVALAHWILPPHLIPAVEVAPGPKTSPATIEAVRDLLDRLGKWPVVLEREMPGYLINRLQFALLREAMDLVGQGVASAEEIDRAVRGSIARRMPVMGLFGQADLAGLDVYRQIFRYLAADLSTIDGPPAALDEAVESGRTGAAVGQGFYSWTTDRRDEALRRRNAELIRLLRADRGG